ncbi:MAG: DnaJ domain-containing protein [Deltaproteobacteria bacterium]|nr:MAG: DnaJ domain-containing protein [Deltaproteobacteria bacterium]
MKILFIILAIIYSLLPYDILPDFLVGWGWLDDLALWGLIWRYLYLQKKKAKGYYQYYQKSQEASQDNKKGTANGESTSYHRQNQFEEETTVKDPYTVLGVDRNASQEEIKKAYRQLVNRYHPDKVAHLGDEFQKLADKRFKEIQEAYQKIRV